MQDHMSLVIFVMVMFNEAKVALGMKCSVFVKQTTSISII
jgi:hypothetical protein